MNDRNDRAIRVATQWFNTHFKTQDVEIKVVLLTDDVQNREKARSDSIPISSSKISAFTQIETYNRKQYFIF